jgi:hypothetical protein
MFGLDEQVCLFIRYTEKKIEEKKYLGPPTPPEDESSFLFGGLLTNPDMPLSHRGMT